jgi:hypothetical protein
MFLWRFVTFHSNRFGSITLRRKLASLGLICGLVGVWLCSTHLPDSEAPIRQVILWASADMAFTILVLSSMLGTMRDISPLYLKVLDLIWVSATAIGVVFAVIQAFNSTADESRDIYNKNWIESRSKAIELMGRAFSIECGNFKVTPGLKCESLARLNNALLTHGIIDDRLVNEACPQFPIDLSLPPPKGYTYERVNGCISAKYIAYVLTRPVVMDKQNAENWRRQTRYWPMLLILFVALRLSKSIAEVFWKK